MKQIIKDAKFFETQEIIDYSMVAFKIDFSSMNTKMVKDYEASDDSDTNFKHLQVYEHLEEDERLVKSG